METLTEAEKKQLVQHMNRNDGDNWTQHAMWVMQTFRKAVTPQECATLFMASMF